MSALEFRNHLEAGDIDGCRAYWASQCPRMPQPESREQAEVVMHWARTEADSISLQARAWSHRWLTERNLPSGLPDRLKPSAERLYPVVREGVGISFNFRNELLKPAAAEIQRAMEDAVNDAYAEGRTEPGFVTARMSEARDKTFKALFGR